MKTNELHARIESITADSKTQAEVFKLVKDITKPYKTEIKILIEQLDRGFIDRIALIERLSLIDEQNV